MMKACYRRLEPYKYQLVDDYAVQLDIEGQEIDTRFIELDPAGILSIKKHYAWDGPSGPTIDTLNFMRGSLVHDALYQLMRMRKLDISFREQADRLLHRICREDGMNAFRAWYVYQSVQLFAGTAAEPGTQREDEIVCVPVGGGE